MSAQASQTLLSTIQKFKSLDTLSHAHAPHPFASTAEASSVILQDLAHNADQLLHSLNVYSATTMSNPKLVSILRQHVAISNSLHFSEDTISHAIDKLRMRSDSLYGEDIPLDRALIVPWCVSRLKAWGTSTGMETFTEEEREGRMTVVLGGKVLVIDIDFVIDRADPPMPRIDVVGAKTSYAVPNGVSSSATEGSFFLDALLAESVRNFCAEVQRSDEVRQPREAARLGKVVIQHLDCLMTLDKLAMKEGDRGVRWFVDMLELGSLIEQFAKREAESVASSLSTTKVPLDIYLLRSHSLPLPYLNSPSISFLTYLSPLAYLTLLRTSSSSSHAPFGADLSPFDIPISHLRKQLSVYPRCRGATIATLSLSPVLDPHFFPPPLSMLTARPSFFLVPEGPNLDSVFPQTVVSGSEANTSQSSGQYTWILDFTEEGKHPGVIMSQSRMRDIELVVNPLSAINHMDTTGMISFGGRSWVDLLLNPTNTVTAERYTATYHSPNSLHPPLRLGLVPPDEPGFFLERARVQNIKEVWGILEVVREQCWLNEILKTCNWEVDDLKMGDVFEEEASEGLLQAVLSGTIIPQKIPVNVHLPSDVEPPNTLFDSASLETMSIDPVHLRRPRVVLTSPERPPLSGLVETTVTYDEARPRGISVDICGALGADIDTEVLEEVCRRGGTLGLPGRVWAKAHVP